MMDSETIKNLKEARDTMSAITDHMAQIISTFNDQLVRTGVPSDLILLIIPQFTTRLMDQMNMGLPKTK